MRPTWRRLFGRGLAVAAGGLILPALKVKAATGQPRPLRSANPDGHTYCHVSMTHSGLKPLWLCETCGMDLDTANLSIRTCICRHEGPKQLAFLGISTIELSVLSQHKRVWAFCAHT